MSEVTIYNSNRLVDKRFNEIMVFRKIVRTHGLREKEISRNLAHYVDGSFTRLINIGGETENRNIIFLVWMEFVWT